MERVAFRVWKDTGTVIAFFLDRGDGRGLCDSYEHVGQHGYAFYPNNTRLATPNEYRQLLQELRSIGYEDLVVVKRGRVKEGAY